jgi:hypothetical protein
MQQGGSRGAYLTRRLAILWITHLWSPELEAAFEDLLRMRNSSDHDVDVWLLLDASTPGANTLTARYKRHHLFDETRLFNLPYARIPGRPRIPGRSLLHHAHFPLLDFYHSHPEYDYFWAIEYDVRYTGQWNQFFASFEDFDHDLITAHIRRYAEEYRWNWWRSLQHPSKVIPCEKYLRSWNVIYRVSRKALAYLHSAQIDGWRGHPEATFPTLLSEAGFRLLDMGGDGEFTPPGFRNRFYTSSATSSGRFSPFGTVRDLPARSRPGHSRNKLYHPIKPVHMVEPWPKRLLISFWWIRSLGKDAAIFLYSKGKSVLEKF